MGTIFKRILRFGSQNFWRYGSASLATVAVMVLALVVFMGLVVFRVATNAAVASVQEKIDISVYFKTTTPEEQILSIRDSVANVPEVSAVEYISKDQALAIFREAHQDDPSISEAINELTDNPLEAHLNIKAHDPDDYGTIAQYFSNNENISQYVDSVSYFENQVVIDRLNSIVRNVNTGGLALTIVLAIIAALVVFNTIWLAIYANRDEISIVEGVIAGAVSGVISFIVAIPFIHIVHPYLASFIPTFSLTHYFYYNILLLLSYQLLFGVFLGALSSFLAVRRYLRN
jgi:cell division transport system permease protein